MRIKAGTSVTVKDAAGTVTTRVEGPYGRMEAMLALKRTQPIAKACQDSGFFDRVQQMIDGMLAVFFSRS